MKFKRNDKIKIPTRKSLRTPLTDSSISLHISQNKMGYSLIKEVYPNGIIVVKIDPQNDSSIWDFLEEDLELYEESFPEKWCIEASKDTYNEINNYFSTLLKRKVSGGGTRSFYHFPEISRNICTASNPEPGYEILDINKFRQITQKQMEKKEIIGWKLVKPEFAKAAEAIINVNWTFEHHGKQNLDKNGWHFTGDTTGNGAESKLRKAGVLGLWFEEVLAPEKPKEITLTLGTSNIKIVISKNSIKADGKEFHIDNIQELYNDMVGAQTIVGYKIEFPSVKIGCSLFTAQNLLEIIESYNELNK